MNELFLTDFNSLEASHLPIPTRRHPSSSAGLDVDVAIEDRLISIAGVWTRLAGYLDASVCPTLSITRRLDCSHPPWEREFWLKIAVLKLMPAKATMLEMNIAKQCLFDD